MNQLSASAGTATLLKMRVRGMDCGACAIKIENALKRLPGVSGIDVNYGAETLSLQLNTDRTSRASVEKKEHPIVGLHPVPLRC